MTPDTYLTITHYAERYDVGRKTVYKWIEAGLLETFRIGRTIRVKNQPPSDGQRRRPLLERTA